MSKPILILQDLKKYFQVRKGFLSFQKREFVRAVDDVNLSVGEGETLALVGETGSGKTTIAKLILRLIDPTEGKIFFDEIDLLAHKKAELKRIRRHMQMIFQDPFASLNPRMTIGDIVGLPLRIHKIVNRDEIRKRAKEILDSVGLVPGSEFIDRYPHEFSGGQRQRIGIARAIATHPKLIVADEPVSALDVSIRSQILNLLKDLKDQFDITFLLIGHDLSVIRHMSDRVAVLYLGKIIELAPTEDLFTNPRHPYSKALISAVPIPDPTSRKQIVKLEGERPNPINPPSGCVFHPRCPYSKSICTKRKPELLEISNHHLVACHS